MTPTWKAAKRHTSPDYPSEGTEIPSNAIVKTQVSQLDSPSDTQARPRPVNLHADMMKMATPNHDKHAEAGSSRGCLIYASKEAVA